MPTYTVQEAENNLSKLIESAERGEEVIIVLGSKPAVRLVPMAEVLEPKRQFGSLKGKFYLDDKFFDPLPEDELRAWEESPLEPEEKS